MNTRILFFGSLVDAYGRERKVDLPAEGLSVAALREQLAAADPAIRRLGVRAAIDQSLAGEAAVARPGQEIAFFSPVSGG